MQAADRFVGAAFCVGRLPEPKNQRQGVAGVLSLMRNVAQPFGMSKADEPDTSQSIWRTVADLTNGAYNFESTTSPNIIWVKLTGLDFDEGAKAQKLDLVNYPDRVDDVTGSFEPVEPIGRCPRTRKVSWRAQM